MYFENIYRFLSPYNSSFTNLPAISIHAAHSFRTRFSGLNLGLLKDVVSMVASDSPCSP